MSSVRKYVLIHCPTGEPNGPFEVKDVEGTAIGTFPTLSEAKSRAAVEARRHADADVILSPLVQGHM
jgi:hypothetical protein